MNLPIESLSSFFRREFGMRVAKVPLDAGFSCPNRDGSVGTGGCVFCNNAAFSPASGGLDPLAQFDRGIARLARRRADAYLPYLQSYTNTHAPLATLRSLFRSLQEHPRSFGLAVSTRPDCLGPEVLDLLAECQRRSFFWVEIGVQTVHEATLRLLNRGHGGDCALAALAECRGRGLRSVAHLIVGLPDENAAMVSETVRAVVGAGVWGIKFHPFHVLAGSALELAFRAGALALMTAQAYVRQLVDLLEVVPEEVVIHRLTAEAPAPYLLGPDWLRDKGALLDQIGAEFARRGTRQGSRAS
jgi:uncharacterized protein